MEWQTWIWLLAKISYVLWTFTCLSIGWWLGRRSVTGNRRMR